MKYALIYFSGTGNTKLITDELKRALEKKSQNVSILSVEELIHGAEFPDDIDVLGIGFPVYKFTYPEIFEKIFPLLKLHNSDSLKKPFFTYSTYCRFNATSLHKMAKSMETLGYSLIAKNAFKSPSNGISSLKESECFDYKTVMYFENRIDLKISQFSDDIISNMDSYIKSGKKEKHKGTLIDNVRINIVGRIEKTRYPLLSIDRKICGICGACVKLCPDDNLTLLDNTIVIKDNQDCLHCLKCMHICKSKAISFGPLTRGPNRYTKQIREQLFKTAAETPMNTPEPGTIAIKRKWALNNLKDWVFGVK